MIPHFACDLVSRTFFALLIVRLLAEAKPTQQKQLDFKPQNFFGFFWRVTGIVGGVLSKTPSNQIEMMKGPKMFHKKFLFVAMFATAITCLSTLDHQSAKADNDFFYLPVYKVQIQYHYFDSNYYHWTTVKTTSDYFEAVGIIFWLDVQRERGRFQQAANQLYPDQYWRYIPVDYRLVFEMQRIPVYFDSVKTLKSR